MASPFAHDNLEKLGDYHARNDYERPERRSWKFRSFTTGRELLAEYNGATLNNRYPLAIKGSEFKWVFLIDGIDGKLTLDHTKKPKAIDFKITGESDHPGPSHKGKTLLGIYKIEGDKLFVYYHHKTRPTEFETRTGNHVIGYVYQREK